jgi:hypothetical protein
MLLAMRPFSDVRADGTLRDPRAVAARLAKAKASRSRRTNGKAPYDQRASHARRLSDLEASYLRDFEAPSEAAVAIARGAALASLRIERIEAREMAGKEVDDERLVRLMGAVNRSVQALAALRPKTSSDRRPGLSLEQHLEEMAARKEHEALEAKADEANQ